MSDLIVKGAGEIKDGLYNIKDGKLFKYKANGGTVRTYPIVSADRPTAHWKDGKWCSNCGEGIPTDVWNGGVEKDEIKFCFSCGARMESDANGSD